MTITKYKISLQCKDCPVAFETEVKAFSRQTAIGKAIFIARKCGLDPTRCLNCVIIEKGVNI
jgi:hypothetical protein